MHLLANKFPYFFSFPQKAECVCYNLFRKYLLVLQTDNLPIPLDITGTLLFLFIPLSFYIKLHVVRCFVPGKINLHPLCLYLWHTHTSHHIWNVFSLKTQVTVGPSPPRPLQFVTLQFQFNRAVATSQHHHSCQTLLAFPGSFTARTLGAQQWGWTRKECGLWDNVGRTSVQLSCAFFSIWNLKAS